MTDENGQPARVNIKEDVPISKDKSFVWWRPLLLLAMFGAGLASGVWVVNWRFQEEYARKERRLLKDVPHKIVAEYHTRVLYRGEVNSLYCLYGFAGQNTDKSVASEAQYSIRDLRETYADAPGAKKRGVYFQEIAEALEKLKKLAEP